MADDAKLIRIGVFYDGNFFHHVSNYYNFQHERRSRISISGLHDFIRQRIAFEEGVDARYCQIVDAHYFRGRYRAREAEERDTLLGERKFEDVLIGEGVITHYLPLSPQGEKGIDVWLALEAFELAMYKKFTVTALVAGDSDFMPLVRKLNTLGTRVMLIGCDFEYSDAVNTRRETKTAQALINEVTYPVLLNQEIDDRKHRNDPMINSLFIPRRDPAMDPPPLRLERPTPSYGFVPLSSEREHGSVKAIKQGFGFIAPDTGGDDVFFSYADLADIEFAELQIGDRVEYTLGRNDRGFVAKDVRVSTTPLEMEV